MKGATIVMKVGSVGKDIVRMSTERMGTGRTGIGRMGIGRIDIKQMGIGRLGIEKMGIEKMMTEKTGTGKPGIQKNDRNWINIVEETMKTKMILTDMKVEGVINSLDLISTLKLTKIQKSTKNPKFTNELRTEAPNKYWKTTTSRFNIANLI